MKVCRQCEIEKSLDEFPKKKDRKDGHDSYCYSCYNIRANKYYHSHKEQVKISFKVRYKFNKPKILKRQKDYVSNNRDKVNEYARGRSKKSRIKFVEMYGGKCDCCGEQEIEFLTIEHIKGQRGVKKKESGRLAYEKAMKEYRPDLYKVLCMNCNHATRFGKICPHQSKREL